MRFLAIFAALVATATVASAAAPLLNPLLVGTDNRVSRPTNFWDASSNDVNRVVKQLDLQPRHPALDELSAYGSTGMGAYLRQHGAQLSDASISNLIVLFLYASNVVGSARGLTDIPGEAVDHFSARNVREASEWSFTGGYPEWIWTPIAGGTISQANPTAGHSGLVQWQTAVSASSGGVLHLGGKTLLHSVSTRLAYVLSFPKTNGCRARVGLGNSTTTDLDANGAGFLVTNQVVVGYTVNNGTLATTEASYSIDESKFYQWDLAATNNVLHLLLLTNGVPVWTASLTNAMPTGYCSPSVGCWNTAPENANGVPIAVLDWGRLETAAGP